jgi:hypothetical protein
MMLVTGQAVVSVSGPGIWYRAPLDSVPGFHELPALLSVIPDQVVLWTHLDGGRIWWWTDGVQAITVTGDDWQYAPPRPLAHWKAIIGTDLVEGDGDVHLPDGYTGAILAGVLQ